MRERRHRHDRISDKNSQKKKKNMSKIFFSKVGVRIPFSVGNFHFFEQDRLLFARVDIGVTEFSTNTAEEEEEEENWA